MPELKKRLQFEECWMSSQNELRKTEEATGKESVNRSRYVASSERESQIKVR